MADVTLVLPRPGEWLATATLHARWILFCAPLLGTVIELILPRWFMMSALLQVGCAMAGGFARQHAPELDAILRPPNSLYALLAVCLWVAFSAAPGSTGILLVYAAFTLAGYTYVATAESRKREVASYRTRVPINEQ